MTNERARSELEQLYMSLSEEKKKAIDTLIKASQGTILNCPSCGLEVHSDFSECPRCGEQLQTCGTCRNEDTYHCAECENKSDYEQAQADGEYILKSEAIRVASGYCHPSNIAKELKKLPSVAIPSAEPCESCCNGNQEKKAMLCQKSYLAGMEHRDMWIPVSERLPEDKQSVLVWCSQYKNIYCAYLEKKQWWIFGAFIQIVPNEVVAWMPLPKPYDSQESGE